jgi:hypothetical protein
MAYKFGIGLTEEQELSFKEREISLQERGQTQRIEIERERLKAEQRGTFYAGLQALATVAIPVLAFFGIRRIADVIKKEEL